MTPKEREKLLEQISRTRDPGELLQFIGTQLLHLRHQLDRQAVLLREIAEKERVH